MAETGRAIHRPAEFRFALHPFPPCPGLLLIDDAGVQIGIDRHLLTRHSVESKAGCDLGRADCAVGYHQKLNGNQREKEDEANDVIAADHELTKRFDDFARSCCAFIAVQQNAPRAGQVERQAQQGKQ